MSSSAIPGLFPSVEWNGTTFVDGVISKNYDVSSGI